MLELPSEVVQKLILSVGTHRGDRPFSPVEVAENVEKAISSGSSIRELAAVMDVDPAMITRFRRLLKLPQNVLYQIDWGQGVSLVSFTVATEVARLESEKEQLELVRHILAHRLSKDEVRQIVQIHLRSKKVIGEAVKDILGMRPQIEKRYVVIGTITSSKVREALQAMTQQQRDNLLKKIIAFRYPELANSGGKLGIDTFTLVGNGEFGNTVQKMAGGLEESVSAWLEREIS
jgi:hypothetical protein